MGNFIRPIGSPSAFWNKPIPMTGWVDKSIMAVGPGIKKTAKVAGIGALAIGGIAALGIVAGNMRGNRKYDARDHVNDLPDMEKDLPQVMETRDFVPQQPAQPTLMGEKLVKDGPHGMKVKMARGEIGSPGADSTSPNIERGGVSVIDGREIKDLGPANGLAV